MKKTSLVLSSLSGSTLTGVFLELFRSRIGQYQNNFSMSSRRHKTETIHHCLKCSQHTGRSAPKTQIAIPCTQGCIHKDQRTLNERTDREKLWNERHYPPGSEVLLLCTWARMYSAANADAGLPAPTSEARVWIKWFSFSRLSGGMPTSPELPVALQTSYTFCWELSETRATAMTSSFHQIYNVIIQSYQSQQSDSKQKVGHTGLWAIHDFDWKELKLWPHWDYRRFAICRFET